MVHVLCTPSDDGLYKYQKVCKNIFKVLELQSQQDFYTENYKRA